MYCGEAGGGGRCSGRWILETRCVGEEGERGRLVKGWVRRGQRQAEVRWRRWPDQVRPLQLPGGAGGQVEWRRQLGGAGGGGN